MLDPPDPMDTSASAIKSALQSSDAVQTTVLLLESIEVEARKKKYIEFVSGATGKKMHEFIGFMPMQSHTFTDATFLRLVRDHFSNGIHVPGRMQPFFSSVDRGACVARTVDKVFTVMEENVDYWVLVCAVAYDQDDVQEAPLFTISGTPPQAMVWDDGIDIAEGSPGWKRHFECIEDMIYVGERDPCEFHPRNVLALALAKLRFSKQDGEQWSRHIVDRPETPMHRGGRMMAIKDMKGRSFQLEGVNCMLNVSLYTRYQIEDEEWPEHIYFDKWNLFSTVFNSWIVEGKLDMHQLLNEGSTKMLTNYFYEHRYLGCLPVHPTHVYLNYMEVAPPADQTRAMITKMARVDAASVVLFGCVNLINYRGHAMYAAIAPGEVANRLGLPTIAGGRFHMIQALPYPKGVLKTIDIAAEMREFYAANPYADDEEEERGEAQVDQEPPVVIDLVSSDKDMGRSPAEDGRVENQVEKVAMPSSRSELAARIAAEAAAARAAHIARRQQGEARNAPQPVQQPARQRDGGVASGSRPVQQVPAPALQLQPEVTRSVPRSVQPPVLPPGIAPFVPYLPPPVLVWPRPIPFTSSHLADAESTARRDRPLSSSANYSGGRVEDAPRTRATASFPVQQPSQQVQQATGGGRPPCRWDSPERTDNYDSMDMEVEDDRERAAADEERRRKDAEERRKKTLELKRLAFPEDNNETTETREQPQERQEERRDEQTPVEVASNRSEDNRERSEERRVVARRERPARQCSISVVLGEKDDDEVYILSPPRPARDRSNDNRSSEKSSRRRSGGDGESSRSTRRGERDRRGRSGSRDRRGRDDDDEREQRRRHRERTPPGDSYRSGSGRSGRKKDRRGRTRSRDRGERRRFVSDRVDEERRDRDRQRRVTIGNEIEVVDLSPDRSPVGRSDDTRRTRYRSDRRDRSEERDRRRRSRSREGEGRRRRYSNDRVDEEKRDRDRRRRDSDAVADVIEIVDPTDSRAPVDRSDEQRRGGGNEGDRGRESRRRRSSAAVENDDEIVALSPPRPTPASQPSMFRPMKISAARHARTARATSPQDSPSTEDARSPLPPTPRTRSPLETGFGALRISSTLVARTARTTAPQEPASAEDTTDPSSFVLWYREVRGARVQSVARLIPAAVVIVLEDQLIKQMKTHELDPLIKLVNARRTDVEKRILIVLHIEFDPDLPTSPVQLKLIDPSVLFVTDHDVENNNTDQLKCCDRLRRARADENGQMIYLTPNISPTLTKNNELGKLGYKVFNTAGAVSFLQEQDEDY